MVKSMRTWVGLMLTPAAAFAGLPIGSSTQTLWNGNSYPTQSWNVANDAPPFDPGDVAYFQPEGMTFYGGHLYIVGDADETTAALVRYQPGPTGNLGAATPILMSAGGSVWGPEGVTVNTSGAGYGAFSGNVPNIVSLESGNDPDANYEGFVGAVDLAGGSPAPVNNIHKPFADFDPDDIAYVPSSNQFVVVNDPARLDFYNHDASALSPAGFSINTLSLAYGDAKGVTVISEQFAELLTGLDLVGEKLIVAHESNDLTIWNLNGGRVGDVLELTSLQIAAEADPSDAPEVESIAVDEANGRIFIGDEAGLAVTVIQVPEPSTAALLVLAGVALLRRR